MQKTSVKKTISASRFNNTVDTLRHILEIGIKHGVGCGLTAICATNIRSLRTLRIVARKIEPLQLSQKRPIKERNIHETAPSVSLSSAD